MTSRVVRTVASDGPGLCLTLSPLLLGCREGTLPLSAPIPFLISRVEAKMSLSWNFCTDGKKGQVRTEFDVEHTVITKDQTEGGGS